ncbi:GNAT family N-acetyltransferase [Nocardioides sp. DS6]|uniref:GNAT family N-acetyltransferase n=1 Tax=Nocardioides eburneus TaxID=3231482 RepID=A0ABV3SYQ0_9ACTN
MPEPSLPSVALENEVVRLEPLSPAHVAALRVAVDADRSSFGYTAVPQPDEVEAYVADRLRVVERGRMASFVQIEAATGTVVGHTTYCGPVWVKGMLRAIEVGHSWLTPAAQGGAVNTASKLLLFRHAFERWGVDRVQLTTDARNERSRHAILAVGGLFEGVARRSGLSRVPGEEGRTRDTAVFSLISDEWPATRARLEARLASRV